MKLMEWTDLEAKYAQARSNEATSKKILLFIITVLIILTVTASLSEFQELFFYNDDHFFVKESSSTVLLILLLPFWLYFWIATLQFLLNYSFKLSMTLAIKSGVSGCLLLIIGFYPFNYYVETTLIDKGYIYCNWLTGSSVRAPDIWLKNEYLCLQDGSVVLSDVYKWFEIHNEKGIEPKLEELEILIQKARSEINR